MKISASRVTQICVLVALALLTSLNSCVKINNPYGKKNKKHAAYDQPAQAALFQKMRTLDPATGEVPNDKMWDAVMQTKELKDEMLQTQNLISALTWVERGSNSDAIGPSNGNTRANSGVTSGRIDAIWVDLADATGKTVWVGGRGGGLWKTTDITLSPATWVPVNDYMINLSIAAITQDPTDHNIMYMCTGESFFEARSLRGNGVFKSTDHGVTWSQLASTNNSTYYYCTRILCDYQGNIYVGTQSGLFRSTKASGGAAWVNITPVGVAAAVSDLEISSTTVAGRLHVINGVVGSLTSRYTDIPLTVASGTWTSPATTIPSTSIRAEIAVSGNTLYCLPSNAAGQTPTVYKSTDGGANWATAGSTPLTVTGDPFANTQGWYNLTVAINPADANQCIIGGIDNAKTINGGTSWTRISDWVFTTGQYVHADQHASVWYDGGNKLLFGCDGGIHYSSDGGTTIRDRNVGLRLKQFYSVAAHPTLTNHFLTGAQDNGTHQFNNAGLSGSIEVFGGDGAYVAIDQDQPQFQVGSYVFSNYRRTTNTGASWIFQSPDDNNGLFINPYDYDNTNNRVYACYSPGNYMRWSNPQSGFTFTAVPVAAFGGQYVGAVSVSPYTANRVYFGMASGGKIIRVDGAEGASPAATDITGAGMPTGSVFMNCINTGSSDQFLVATYSNYGTNNIWVSTNGGTSWTNIDGNLPDMPVYWATFHPDNNSKMFIATETGVWETDLINGASTVWTANTTFPTARATMLKYRTADRTLAASSYGRGLWTSVIPSVTTPDIQFQSSTSASTENTASTTGCRGYTDFTSTMQILNPPTGAGSATVTLAIAGGGTAIQGVDYDITTNGSFAAPSMQLSFAVGSTTPQPFTIRIYDDAAVETAETFTLNYSLAAGGTNAQIGTSNQTMIYTISDNDAAPIANGTFSNAVGTYNANATQQAPFHASQAKYRIQTLFTLAELNAAGITGARNFTSMTLRVVTKNSTLPFTNFTISMANSGATNLNTGFQGGTFTTVYPATNYSTVVGNNLFNFSTPFAWDGTSNILINFCYDNAAAGLSDVVEVQSPFAANLTTFSNGVVSSPCTAAASFISTARIKATFGTSITGTPVSTALNSTKTAYLGPNDDTYFYDGSGNIIARIKNLTAFDYGCTQIIIDRAGSSSAQFWNNAAANYLLSKSVRVIPANNTSSGSYEITLYYTAAEVSGWEAATGRTWAASNMQVVKVNNGFFIPDVTPAIPHTADVALVTGNKGTLGTNYTIRGDFSSTGFSGFGVGVPGNALLTSDFITKATGNFTDGLIWQYNNEGAGYVDALQAPAANNNVTIQAAHTVALNAGFTINTGKTFTVNGTLNCGTNTINGAGGFVTAAASTLGIGSVDGITASGATGNIQTTTRTFSTTGNYTYNGVASQAAGNGLPANINNLVIANTGGASNNIVSLSSAVAVNGATALTSGILSIGPNTLTLNGAVSGSGTFTGTASGGVSTSNLVVGGAAGTLNFTQTTAATRSLNNLTLNSGSSATLGNTLDVYGTIALTSATLNLNAQNLTLKSNTNNTARIGNLTGSTLSGATNVTVERWIKLRLGGTGRAYRLLAPTVNTTGHPTKPTIRDNWMEGGMNTAIGTNVNPVPLFGTQITGAGGNANGFDRTQTNQSSFYSVTNAVTPTYTAIANTSGSLNALTGYFLYLRGDRSMDMTIPLAVGMPTSSTTLRTTGALLTGTHTGFTNPFTGGAGALNLVTNPYASPIDWALVQPACTNVATAYTFWDPNFGTRGGFVTVNTAGVASSGLGTRFIQSGQAFFVQSTGGVPTVSIQEAHKSAGNNNDVFIVPPPPVESFRTELYFNEPNGYRRIADGAIALFDNSYSAGIDGNDASEINNWDENIAIVKAGKHLAIESRPIIFKTDSLLLFMNNMKQQQYEFEFTPSAFTNPGMKAELVDNFTGSRTILSLTGPTAVSFKVTADPASAAPNRFKVLFNAIKNEVPVSSDNNTITIYPNPVTNRIIAMRFNSAERGNYNLRLVNSSGQVVMTKTIYHAGGNAVFNLPVNSFISWGTYTLEILKPDNKKLQKALVILK